MPTLSASLDLSASTFTLLFIALLIAVTLTRLVLIERQMRHVRTHRPSVPPHFADRISLEAHQKAADYTLAKQRLARWGLGIEVIVLLAWTLGGGLEALHSFWATRTSGFVYALALAGSFTFAGSVIELPLSLYRQFVLEARFGFNRMTPGLFVADLIKGTLLGAALGIPLLWAVLAFVDGVGPLWWLATWGFWMVFNLLMLMIYPNFIAPLFNKFQPLEDPELKGRIEALLQRCGFASSGLFVMDGSRRSSHGNAYFSGFGQSKRIVLFDTLKERLTPGQIEAVLAHELGHFRCHHIWKRIVTAFASSFIALALLGALTATPAFYAGLGVVDTQGQTPIMALLLFGLSAPLVSFFLTPVSSALSRRHEYEADAYAARQVDAGELIAALVKLYEDNASTLTPDPLHSLFYDSHPPASLRIQHLQATAAGATA